MDTCDRIVPKQEGVEANKRNGDMRYTRSLTITDRQSSSRFAGR